MHAKPNCNSRHDTLRAGIVIRKTAFEKNSQVRWVGSASAPMRYDAAAMAQIDWEKEHQRLAALYAAMEQGELEQIAAQSESLTEVARQALHSEMSSRGITALRETSKRPLRTRNHRTPR